jgi:hypothetical protein
MERKHPRLLVIPPEAEWPLVRCSSEGELVIRRRFIREVEQANGLLPGSLPDSAVVDLLVSWYRERRKLGFESIQGLEQAAARSA